MVDRDKKVQKPSLPPIAKGREREDQSVTYTYTHMSVYVCARMCTQFYFYKLWVCVHMQGGGERVCR